MNSTERKRYETLIRIRQFADENAADFPAGTIAASQFAVIADAVDRIEQISAEKLSGFSELARQVEVKDTARENVRADLVAIARTARSMEYARTGIADKFRFRQNMGNAVMLAAARAFAADAAEYEAEFIAYGLPSAFIADLTAEADAFEAAFSATASARGEHITATAEIAAYVRRGMVAKRVLDGIVKNRYAHSIGKLAAWISAAHVERQPQRKKAEPLPPPAPPAPQTIEDVM